MRRLRHATVQRFFSLGLVLSLGLWLVAPVAASPSLAQNLGLPGELESVLADALAEASTPESFVERLAASLTDGPDADALAHVLETEPDALLALLYGHLFQAFGYHTGLDAVPTAASGAAASPAPLDRALPAQVAHQAATAPVQTLAATAVTVVWPAALLTAAQPLGP